METPKSNDHEELPWHRSDEAMKHLRRVLTRSGIPFEVLIAKECQRFANVYSDEDTFISSTRLLYAMNMDYENALREIDQCVSIYQEIDIAEVVGFQLQLQILIECKRREDLQVYAFSLADDRMGTPTILASSLARSKVCNSVVDTINNDLSQPLCRPTLVKDAEHPKISDENLIYKAASSLIDFIRADTPLQNIDRMERTLREIGILDEFEAYLAETNYHGPLVARRWLSGRVEEYRHAYISAHFDSRKVFHLVNLYLPIVCLDSPLFEVELDHEANITSIEETDVLMTGIRPRGWPHELRDICPQIGPEGIIAITTRTGLQDLLSKIYDSYLRVVDDLQAVDREAAEELMLEAGFLSVIAHRSSFMATYRSDLDFGWRV